MDLLNKITENEYKMLDLYRQWYSFHTDGSGNKPVAPIKEVLGEWERSNQDLYKLLGENLIITKDFSYEKGHDEIYNELYDIFDKYSSRRETRLRREGWKFIENFKAWVERTYPTHSRYYWENTVLTEQQLEENRINKPIKGKLQELILLDTLADNTYTGETFSVVLANGKEYSICNGCKPMRVLAKIADSYGIEGFEDFRICHSQVHNKKKTYGQLSLSIHPLDYWTMSDNDCDWDSCMNWRDYGGYRQGTVEMMNSPCVVIAYMNAETPMNISGDLTWSNKKWRSLFIVDRGLIINVKDYPYKNEFLDQEILKWLRDLAKENLGWEYTTEEPVKYESLATYTNQFAEDKREFKISFTANCMYVDISSGSNNYMFLGKELDPSVIDCYSEGHPYLYFNYSGASQCVHCGAVTDAFNDESCLCCNDCENWARCDECGEVIYDGDSYTVGDMHLCESCYNNIVVCCDECHEEFIENCDKEPLNLVKIVLPNDEELKNYVAARYQLGKEYEHFYDIRDIYLCNDCLSLFSDDYLKENTKLKCYTDRYSNNKVYCVIIDDLNDAGKRAYVRSGILTALKNNESTVDIVTKFLYSYNHCELIPCDEG